MNNKFGLLASLYVAQFLPIAFFQQTFPVFLRQEGFSLETIGLTSLLSLPWTLKFIWSPIVDRYGWSKIGHYKSWILAMQGMLVLTICFCSFLDVRSNFKFLLGCLLFVTFLAATQDIASDALAVKVLSPSERGFGNSVQVGGNYLGAILGGGGILIFVDSWGINRSFWVMALTILLLSIPVLFYSEKKIFQPPENFKFNWLALFNFCFLPQMWRWLLVLLLYTMGLSMAWRMQYPMLVDLGISLSQIGLMMGLVSFSAGLVAAFIGGLVMKVIGRKKALISFEILIAIAIGAWILPSLGFANLALLYALSIAFQFAYSMALIPMYAIMMDKSRTENAGSDFTLQVSLVFVGSYLTGVSSGYIASTIDYQGVFAVACFISLITAAIVAKFFHEENPSI